MKKVIVAVVLLAGMTLAAAAAAATRTGGERWGLSHGPDGGPVNAVVVAPSAPETVYVGTNRGAFRSTNGGRTWTSLGLAPPSSPDGSSVAGVTSLAVDPRTPRTVYAGLNGRWNGGTTYRRPLFKTTDGGKTWRPLGLVGQPVAIAPAAPATVYVAAPGRGGTSRLLRSSDGGRSWEPADGGLPRTYLWALAFDPTAPATVYAAMGEHGIFRSSDGGTRWRPLDVPVKYGGVTAIAVDPRQPQTVYGGADNGLIETLDGGRSWQMLNAAMGGHGRDRGYMQVSALVVGPNDSRTVYATTECAGVFKSTDGGRRWNPANTGLDPTCGWSYGLALDPRAPQILYAADGARGVFKSLDGGARWHAANAGLSLSTVFSVSVNLQSPPTVYAAVGGLGLFKSSDGGAHWQPLAPNIKLVDGVAADPINPEHVLAAVPGYGVVRSVDAGRTWTGARFGPPARGTDVVAISGEAAYAGTFRKGFFASADGGRTWRKRGALNAQALAIAPGTVVYAGSDTMRDTGLYKSTDGGSNWQRLNDAGVNAIALDPKDPATIYVGTDGGANAVLRSTDGGASWQRADAGLPRFRVKIRAQSANQHATGKSVEEVEGLNALVIDPVHPSTLYAAVFEHGVFRSTNSGRSWQSFNAGRPTLEVRTLALDATGQTLYAGTAGGGVVSFRRNP